MSVFREERKKGEERCAVFPLENAALVKKNIHYELNQNRQHLPFVFLFFGETLLMCRFKTLANACKCPEMPCFDNICTFALFPRLQGFDDSL